MSEPTSTTSREGWRISLAWNVMLVAVVAATCLGALTFGTVNTLTR